MISATDLKPLPLGIAKSSRPFSLDHTLLEAERFTALHAVPSGLVDRLLPPSRRNERLLQRVSGQIEDLVVRNVENLRWSLLQSLERAFLTHKPLVRESLSHILKATLEAVQRTLQKRRTLQEESAEGLARLKEALQELRRLQDEVRHSGQAPERTE